jgi:hypothetical protein
MVAEGSTEEGGVGALDYVGARTRDLIARTPRLR